MITCDFHTHTRFSTDSQAEPEDMLKRAIALGLTTYCITDHMDYAFPENPNDFQFDVPSYFEELTSLKEQYHKQIDLRIGIELGLRDEPELITTLPDAYRRLLAAYPFDFVIGSVHCLQHCDPYYPAYWEDKTPEEGIRLYLQAMLSCAKHYDGFHIHGHLDYLKRYVPGGCQVDFSAFTDITDALLKTIIENGRGIEVNTSYYAKGNSEPHPSIALLKRYHEFGGELLTIGSDAHAPQQIAYDFKRAQDLLTSLGFRYYAEFCAGKPTYHLL